MPRQLKMVWAGTTPLPEVDLPEGYAVRSFREGDEEKYAALLNDKDLGSWTVERLQSIFSNSLSPDGTYFVTYSDDLVAVASALDAGGGSVGEVGWVAAEPAHKGKNLGMAVCTAATNHLLDRGYEEIFLLTDHWRYPALKIYLKLGFEPRRDGPDDRYLWQKICERLEWQLPEPKKAKYVKRLYRRGDRLAHAGKRKGCGAVHCYSVVHETRVLPGTHPPRGYIHERRPGTGHRGVYPRRGKFVPAVHHALPGRG